MSPTNANRRTGDAAVRQANCSGKNVPASNSPDRNHTQAPLRAVPSSVAAAAKPCLVTEDVDSKGGGFNAAKEQWLKTLASHPNLSGADLSVAIFLSSYFNSKTRDAWPSVRTLADDTNRNLATVWRSLVRLEQFAFVEVIRRGRSKSNRYRPKLGRLNVDPASLRRKTKPRERCLRIRNLVSANSQSECL